MDHLWWSIMHTNCQKEAPKTVWEGYGVSSNCCWCEFSSCCKERTRCLHRAWGPDETVLCGLSETCLCKLSSCWCVLFIQCFTFTSCFFYYWFIILALFCWLIIYSVSFFYCSHSTRKTQRFQNTNATRMYKHTRCCSRKKETTFRNQQAGINKAHWIEQNTCCCSTFWTFFETGLFKSILLFLFLFLFSMIVFNLTIIESEHNSSNWTNYRNKKTTHSSDQQQMWFPCQTSHC